MMPWQKLMYHLLTGAGFPAEVVVLRWGCSVWPKLQRLLRSGVWLAWPDGFTLELPTKRITADVRRRQQVTSTCRVHVASIFTHSIPLDPKIWELWTSCSESSHVVSRCVRSSCWEKDFVFVHVYIYIYIHLCICIFICICICICIYL